MPGPDRRTRGRPRPRQSLRTRRGQHLVGDTQYADRNGERIPIHGGNGVDGTTNGVGYDSSPGSTTETIPKRTPTVAARWSLTKDGYMVNNGSNFIMSSTSEPLEATSPRPRCC